MRMINIDGNEYPVKFGLIALKTMLAKYNLKRLIDTEELMTKLEVDYLPKALELGLANGCKIAGVEAPDSDTVKQAFENDLSLMTKTIDILSKDITGEPEKAPDEKKEKAKPGPTYKK
jgi:hypothetical protein